MPRWQDYIVYQHQDWLLLNKPAGFSVQNLMALWSCEFTAFHPVHRLDKETTGLWLVALNSDANQALCRQFQERKVKKLYLAITSGKPNKKQGVIKGDMQRSRRSQWHLCRSQENPAITFFKSVGLGSGLRLVLCQPLTGKTHQIRVALKSLGSAIAGDRIYAAANAQQFDRLYLHAYALAFEWQGQFFSFQCEPNSGDLFVSDECHSALGAFTDPLTYFEKGA